MTYDAPGLKKRLNKDGTPTWYWVAANCVRDTMGFTPRTARLIGETDEDRARECLRLHSELQEWLSGQKGTQPPGKAKTAYTGSLASLIDVYQTDELSPFQELRHKTKEGYLSLLTVLRRRVGERRLATVTGADLKRWHRKFRDTARERGFDGTNQAHSLMTMLRTIIKFGASVHEIPECKRLRDVLEDLRFKMPRGRTKFLTYDQVAAVIEQAHELGRPSIALGQAMQFDLTLRQYDVIGYWEPGKGGVEHHGKTWRYGLTWNHIDDDMMLRKAQSKIEDGPPLEYNLRLYDLVQREISRVPQAKRVGPMIVDEDTGRPYSNGRYSRKWREIARAAGVPDDVLNRDSRAGGVTEATDIAGMDIEHVRHHAHHSNLASTTRYSRSTLAKTSNVAQLRAASRKGKNAE